MEGEVGESVLPPLPNLLATKHNIEGAGVDHSSDTDVDTGCAGGDMASMSRYIQHDKLLGTCAVLARVVMYFM